MNSQSRLAINGGTPVRTTPFPARSLITNQEKEAAVQVFDEAIATGNAFGYNGKYEQQYEKDFVDFMGGGFADGVNSGTNAVFCAIGALGLEPLSEIIVPPITDAGGIMPVLFANCVPVVADADLRTYNTSATQIEPMITERTKAIIVAHIGGEPVDMDPIMTLAKKYNLYVIEDCAQSHGAKYKNQFVGSIGDIAAFSTMFGKHHCTGGQGGIVYTKNKELYWKAKRFADRGKPFNIQAPGNVTAGLNCNLNELSAAIGSVQIKKLPGIIKNRRIIGEEIKLKIANQKAISVGWQVPDTECVYWFLRMKLETSLLSTNKEDFCKALAAEGIPVVNSYRIIPCEYPWFRNKAVFGQSGFPWNCSDYRGSRNPVFKIDNAIKASENHFNITINEAYTQKEIDDIITALIKVENAFLR